MPRFAVILPAAGRSSRFGGREKKPFANLDGRAVWLRSAELFVTRPDVVQTLLLLDPEDDELFRTRYAANIAFMNVKLVHGGAERSDSVANALAHLAPEVEFVAVHDAVRPCAPPELIDAVFAAAVRTGAAIAAVPLTDTLKRGTADRYVTATEPRADLWRAQTPQAFRRDWIEQAYQNRGDRKATDDAELVEALGHPVLLIEGDPGNLKITTRGDLRLAEAVLKSRPKPKGQRPIHPFADEEMWR